MGLTITITCLLLHSCLLLVTAAGSSSSEASARTEAAAEGGEAGLVSRVLGLPGVWWGARETVSSAWGLVAAGLSSVLVGASVLPQLAQGPRATSRRDEVTERIYRGVVAQPHSWPWVAKLKTTFKRPGAKTRRRACGGALISARFILTARHCVSWDHSGQVVDGRRVAVWLGSHGREGQDGVSLPVKRIIIRPDYQQPQCASGVWCPDWAPWGHTTLTNDIALLELLHPAPAYNPNIAPIKVARQSPPPGTTAWVGGWGLDGFHPTRTLNLAPMAVQKDSFRECKQQMSPGKMCVIGKDFGGPCPGDSGSPLVTYSKHTGPRLIGLVSNGAESCKAGLPGIFTRVSHYADWVELAQDTARRVGSQGTWSDIHTTDHQQQHQHHNQQHHQQHHQHQPQHHYNPHQEHYHQPHQRPQHHHQQNYFSNHRYSNFESAFLHKSKYRPRPPFGRSYKYPHKYYY